MIVGAGGVGMNAVQIAKSAFGIDPIVCDIDPAKLEGASKAGVRDVFDAKDAASAKAITALTKGGAHTTIDFVGSESSTQFALRTLGKGGKLVVVGLFGGMFKMPLPMIPILARTIQGSYVGNLAEMSELMQLVRQGKIRPLPKGSTRVDRMKRKLQTKAGANIYAARKSIVEPVFGQIKHARGYRRFLMRGVEKVKAEWALVCATHNILKMYRLIYS